MTGRYSAFQLVCCEKKGAVAPYDNQINRHLGQRIGNLSLGTSCSLKYWNEKQQRLNQTVYCRSTLNTAERWEIEWNKNNGDSSWSNISIALKSYDALSWMDEVEDINVQLF